MDVVENVPGEVMMVSTDFVMKVLELMDLLGFDFVCDDGLLILLMRNLALSRVCSWSCKVSETKG